jgi:hypothetical protein
VWEVYFSLRFRPAPILSKVTTKTACFEFTKRKRRSALIYYIFIIEFKDGIITIHDIPETRLFESALGFMLR